MKKQTERLKKSKATRPKSRAQTKTKAQLKKDILAFLNSTSTQPGKSKKPGCPLKHGLACVLATVKNNEPRATPVDFFNDGLTIWIAGEPGLKIRNIRSNPRVAVGIYHPMDHSKLNRSLQVKGKASMINVRDHKRTFMARAKKFGLVYAVEKIIEKNTLGAAVSLKEKKERIEKILSSFNLIRIDPDEITFLYIHPSKGMEKHIWKK